MPCCGSVGGCGARAVSRKTPIYFIYNVEHKELSRPVNKVPRWVFRYVGYKTFDFSSKKKGFLPKNNQIWPKIGIFGQFGPGHAGSVGGCGARAVSRETPIYFMVKRK